MNTYFQSEITIPQFKSHILLISMEEDFYQFNVQQCTACGIIYGAKNMIRVIMWWYCYALQILQHSITPRYLDKRDELMISLRPLILFRAVPENMYRGVRLHSLFVVTGWWGPGKNLALGAGGISAVYGNERYW